MIKKFGQFITEGNNDSRHLLYYAFDWDDNILNMPTKILMYKLVDGEWVPTKVSTAEFAVVRDDKVNWKIDYDVAFLEFRDQGPRGEVAFLEDVKKAISSGAFGPAWGDFIECLVNGSLFAIITARGHEENCIRMGIEWIIDNILSEDQLFEMYNNLLKFSYLFKSEKEFDRILRGKPSENELIKMYLDSCDFVGVSSPSRGGSPANPEKSKEDALMLFKSKINDFALRLGVKAAIGFSDDDLKNVKHIEDLVDNLNHEQFPNIAKYVVKGTNDPSSITKKVRLIETANQAVGLESSVLPFTQFNNMTSKLYPSGPENRQNDFLNQFKRQTEYLAKNSKELFKDGKFKKKYNEKKNKKAL